MRPGSGIVQLIFESFSVSPYCEGGVLPISCRGRVSWPCNRKGKSIDSPSTWLGRGLDLVTVRWLYVVLYGKLPWSR